MRRSSHPPPDLGVSTAKLREGLDRLASSLGERPQHRPVSSHSLASVIRTDNEARRERVAAANEQDNARVELLTACSAIASTYSNDYTIMLFQTAVQEFLTALGAATPQRRIDAIQAMREAVQQMDRYRTGDRT